MAEPTITFDEGTGVTVIEVATADRVGLAFSLASALAELDCTIVKATLSTLGPNAVDTFSVSEATGGPLADRRRGGGAPGASPCGHSVSGPPARRVPTRVAGSGTHHRIRPHPLV